MFCWSFINNHSFSSFHLSWIIINSLSVLSPCFLASYSTKINAFRLFVSDLQWEGLRRREDMHLIEIKYKYWSNRIYRLRLYFILFWNLKLFRDICTFAIVLLYIIRRSSRKLDSTNKIFVFSCISVLRWQISVLEERLFFSTFSLRKCDYMFF